MNLMRSHVLLVVAVLAIGLTGCAPKRTTPNVNLGGYPPAFREGYLDGCNSARSAIGEVRDEARFASDSMYAAGWRDGNDICSRSKP